MPAQSTSYRPAFRAYARVVPIQTVSVEATLKGVIEGLSARPGQRLAAGAVIARIGGPDQEKALKDAEAQLSSARETYAAARDADEAVRKTYPKFSDRQQLDRAKSELAAAEAELADAKTELHRAEALSTVVSPTTGEIVSLKTANGDRVVRGSPVLVLQPEHDLWVQAIFYGVPDALLTPSRAAEFVLADNTREIPVQLAQVLPSLRPDGGLTAFFTAAEGAPDWRGGEAGELVLQGPAERAVSVPTAALIMDRGRWWVLVKTGQGLVHRLVVPGPSRGGRSLVLRGLGPGDQVVVRDAYLLFHRDFGQEYSPPD